MSGGRATGPGSRFVMSGDRASDLEWLAQQVEDSMRRWHTTDRRTAVTLWWYSGSLEMLTRPVYALATGRADADEFGRQILTLLDRIIDPLCAASGVRPARLRAIASDALGNRLLAEGRIDLAPIAAAACALLQPQFVQIRAGARERLYLRRASCCMIFRLPGQELCVSCPRQLPADRLARLERHAGS